MPRARSRKRIGSAVPDAQCQADGTSALASRTIRPPRQLAIKTKRGRPRPPPPFTRVANRSLADRALTMLQCNPLLSHLLAISRKLSFSSRVKYVGCLENENAYARPRRPCRSLLAQPLVECFSPVVHYDADS